MPSLRLSIEYVITVPASLLARADEVSNRRTNVRYWPKADIPSCTDTCPAEFPEKFCHKIAAELNEYSAGGLSK